MKNNYRTPLLEICPLSDILLLSGDGYANDPWSEGFGGKL